MPSIPHFRERPGQIIGRVSVILKPILGKNAVTVCQRLFDEVPKVALAVSVQGARYAFGGGVKGLNKVVQPVAANHLSLWFAFCEVYFRGGRGISDQLIGSGLLMKDRREDGKTEALYS